MENKKRSLTSNTLYLMSNRLANILFPLLTSVCFSRILHPEGIGAVSYVSTTSSYFTLLAALGVIDYGTREIAKADSLEKRQKVVSELFIVNSISTTFSLVLYFIAIMGFWRTSDLFEIYLFYSLPIILNYFNVDWFFQGREEFKFIAFRNIAAKAIIFGLSVVFVHTPDDLTWFGLLSAIGVSLNYVFNAFKFFKEAQLRRTNLNVFGRARPVLVVFVGVALGQIYSKVDITMIGMLRSDREVGLYTNALSIANGFILLLTALTAGLLPRLSRLERYNLNKLEETVSYSLSIVLFFALPLTIMTICLADPVVVVAFGSKFAESANCLRVLALLILLLSVFDLLCYQLVLALGYEKWFLPSRLVGVLLNVGLNLWLIPRYSLVGAAIASVVAEFVLNSMILVRVLGKIRLETSVRRLWKLTIPSLCLSVFLLGLMNLGAFPSLVYLVAGCLLGPAIYLLVAWFCGIEFLSVLVSKVVRGR